MSGVIHGSFGSRASRAEEAVLGHYGSDGLIARVFETLSAAGIDPEAMSLEDIAGLEHMHTGGARATHRLIGALRPLQKEKVIDIGCGIGGVARQIAHLQRASVTGVDLVPEFIELAKELSRRTGLAERTQFLLGSALALPVPDEAFDAAVIMHVGMNIEDKEAMLAEAFRVLRPDGRLALCDIMLGPLAEPLLYPVPWAQDAETSHLATPEAYRALAADVGFVPVSEHDYYGAELSSAPIGRHEGPHPIGTHLMMGPDARRKVANHLDNLDAGRVIPVQMIFVRP